MVRNIVNNNNTILRIYINNISVFMCASVSDLLGVASIMYDWKGWIYSTTKLDIVLGMNIFTKYIIQYK